MCITRDSPSSTAHHTFPHRTGTWKLIMLHAQAMPQLMRHSVPDYIYIW